MAGVALRLPLCELPELPLLIQLNLCFFDAIDAVARAQLHEPAVCRHKRCCHAAGEHEIEHIVG